MTRFMPCHRSLPPTGFVTKRWPAPSGKAPGLSGDVEPEHMITHRSLVLVSFLMIFQDFVPVLLREIDVQQDQVGISVWNCSPV